MKLIAKVLLNAFLLWVVAYVVPGISISNFFASIVAFLILSIVNATIKPVLSLLTLPVNFLTLGILGLLINVLLFMLVADLVPGFEISNFFSAFIGLVFYSLLQTVTNILE